MINKNISFKQKLGGIISLILFLGLAYFVFSPIHLKDSFQINFYIPLVPAAVLWYLIFSSNKSKNKSTFLTRIKIAFENLVFYLSLYFLILMFMYSAFPSVYTSLKGAEFNTQVQIIKKIKTHPISRGCSLDIYVDLFKTSICASQQFYNSVSVGDKIVLEGKQSRFGFKIDSMSSMNDSK